MKRALAVFFLCSLCGLGRADVKPAAKDTAQQKAAAQDKETYLNKANKQVQEWTSKIQALEQQSQSSGVKTRQEFDKHIQAIKSSLETARKKIDELQGSSTNAWNSLRDGLDRTFDDVKRHYQKAVSAAPVAKK